MYKLNSKSLLWEFYYPEHKRRNFIFGTMHLKSKEALQFFEGVKPYIKQCQALAAETNLEELESSELNHFFAFTSEKDLRSFLSEKEFIKMRRILLKSFDIDLLEYVRFKPLFIINMITERVLKSLGNKSLDLSLWDYALYEGKQLCGVESIHQQKETFEKITLEYQLKQLKGICRNVSKFRRQLYQLSRYYTAQDITSLYKASRKSMGSLREELIYGRNTQMSSSILNLTSEASVFVAVGAAHLVGEKGVLRNLKNAGLMVKPIVLC